jgi:hypothetical protein
MDEGAVGRGGAPIGGAPTGGPPVPEAAPLTEVELTELALAADPEAPLDDDAVPMAVYLGGAPGLLPEWYMPAPMVRRATRWRVPVVVVMIAAFLVIEAMGLCTAFGQLVVG